MPYSQHVPVLTEEIINLFRPKTSDVLLDATVGTGGHTAAYLVAAAPGGKVIGLDADAKAISAARRYLSEYTDRVTLITTNFAFLKDSLMGGGILNQEHTPLFTHILFDLGIGSHQLDDETGGFSFRLDGPLNMKFGTDIKLPTSAFQSVNYVTQKLGHYPTAAELIAHQSDIELRHIIQTLGEERYAGRIAQALKRQHPTTTEELAVTVRQAVPKSYEHGRIDPATRTFQALRLAVNRELEALSQALPQAVDLLVANGTLAVISFHSLEDRIVKQYLRQSSLSVLTKKPLVAGAQEINRNPRARTAKLRAAIKKPPG